MDISSLVGFLLAFGLIIGSMLLGTAPITAFIDIPSALVVIGGAFAAALICFPLGSILKSPIIALKVILNKGEDRLGLMSRNEMISHEIAIRGVMSIQSGESPHAIDQKLRTFLPPKQREVE